MIKLHPLRCYLCVEISVQPEGAVVAFLYARLVDM